MGMKPIVAVVLTINLFYFSRELLYNKLFGIKRIEPLQAFTHRPMITNESKNLPANIQEIIKQKYDEVPLSEYDESATMMNETEDLFISAIRKAEKMITEKVELLRKQKVLKKGEVEQIQEEIKEEMIKTLPDVPTLKEEIEWINWRPEILNEQLLNQEIFCDKCQRTFTVKDMKYEVQKETNYYEVVTKHESTGEEHKSTTRMTFDTYEILSRPILTITPIISKEVPA